MKVLIMAIIVVLGSVAVTAFAKPFHHSGHHGPDEGRLKKQLEKLDLNANQKQSVAAILEEAKAKSKALRKEQRALFKSMHTLDIVDVSEAQVNELSEAMGQTVAERFRHHMQTHAAIAAILTPEQREQWRAIHEKHYKKKMQRRMKWHGEEG